MRLVIRTDLGGYDGLGHARRCVALALDVAARDVEVIFVTKTRLLKEYVAPFECTMWSEGGIFNAGDVLVIDTTDPSMTDPEYIRAFLHHGMSIIRIDHPDATRDTCHLLVLPQCHTPPSTLARLRTAFGDRLLAGANYVMLPQDVTAQAPIPYAERMHGPIVFCAGGSDPHGVLTQMAEWCGGLVKTTEWVYLLPDYAMSMMTHYPWAQYRPFLRSSLREAALVVTTMGVTVYECLFWHVPVLVVGHTDRHCAAMYGLQPYVACCDMRGKNRAAFQAALTGAWQRDVRMALHAASMGILDGKGVGRVAERIVTIC